MNMTIVDCHMVVGAGTSWGLLADPRATAGNFGREVNYEPDQALEECARVGVERACVVTARNQEYEAPNRYVADLCEKYSPKFIGIAAHSPQREEGRIRKLLTAEIRSMGLKAVRSDGHPTRELLDTAQELDIPVIYYPHMQSGQGPAQFFHMPALAYPKVKFILPHLGKYGSVWWTHIEAIDLAKRYPNVFVDTSAINEPKYLIQAAEELPAEKILFGSSGPELDARVAVETVRLLHLTQDKLAKVMGGNILRLLRM